jgi:hypothetical protein
MTFPADMPRSRQAGSTLSAMRHVLTKSALTAMTTQLRAQSFLANWGQWRIPGFLRTLPIAALPL